MVAAGVRTHPLRLRNSRLEFRLLPAGETIFSNVRYLLDDAARGPGAGSELRSTRAKGPLQPAATTPTENEKSNRYSW